MLQFILALLAAAPVYFRNRQETALEVLAPRHQLGVLQRSGR